MVKMVFNENLLWLHLFWIAVKCLQWDSPFRMFFRVYGATQSVSTEVSSGMSGIELDVWPSYCKR